MLAIRGQQKVFGRGVLKLLYPQNRRILSYLRELQNADGTFERVLCVANMARTAQAVELDLSQFAGQVPVEMVGGTAFPPIGRGPYQLTLPPHGFYWFMLAGEAQMPVWYQAPPESLPELQTFVVRSRLGELMNEPSRSRLEETVLPAWLPKRRWFAGKEDAIQKARIVHATEVPGEPQSILLAEVEVDSSQGPQRYFVPMAYLAEEETTSALPHQLALGRVRQGRKVGTLTDAASVDVLAHRVLAALRDSAHMSDGAGGELRFVPTSHLASLQLAEDAPVRHSTAEQSNSSIILGDTAILKVIRRINGGQHPEAEMGRYLTENGFANLAPLLGEVTRVDRDGIPYVLAVLQGFLHNQGDAWSWSLNILQRAVQDLFGVQAVPGSDHPDALAEFAHLAAVLGKRIGEMHAVLAIPTTDAAFAPEQAGAEHTTAWEAKVADRLAAAMQAIERHGAWQTEADTAAAERVLAGREVLSGKLAGLAARGAGSILTRTHGDLHLGQILVAQDDAYIIDFEGEPARPLEERRAKTSPLRDVAGVLRSFAYVAEVGSQSGGPAPTPELEQARAELTDRFRRTCEDAFLAAYVEATRGTPCEITPDSQRALVDLFLIEKAAYELTYEAESRPTWMGVPLRGLAELVIRLQAEGAS